MDFTHEKYKLLLVAIMDAGYKFITLKDHALDVSNNLSISKYLILRHDVDRKPENSLKLAMIEHSLGIKGSYYFRAVKDSYNVDIIREITKLGHEIGYHYEDVDLVYKKMRFKFSYDFNRQVLVDESYVSFCKHLKMFREHSDISTICMHGSPLSKFDNRIIWENYSYKDLDILCEPYFDIDFDEFCYFTDTGRRWNGNDVSVRDKVESKFQYNFKKTSDIINNMEILPNKIMLTIHPQRWHKSVLSNIFEYLTQSVKNAIKKTLYVKK